MDRLWAPWRMNYIGNIKRRGSSPGSRQGCIFCQKPRQRNDKKSYILDRGKHCFVMLNIYPYNNGHIMIAPYRHIKDLRQLNPQEWLEMLEILKHYESVLGHALKPGGYNIGLNLGKAAGAGFAGHLHLHIVPRWVGDTNFMPTLAATRVISQALDELYARLKNAQRNNTDY